MWGSDLLWAIGMSCTLGMYITPPCLYSRRKGKKKKKEIQRMDNRERSKRKK